MFVFCVRNVAFTVLLANVMHFSIGRGNIINVDFSKKFGFKISRGQKKNYKLSVNMVASNKNRPAASGSLHGSYSPNWKNSKIIKDPTKPTRQAPQPPNLDSLPPSSGNLYESPINWKNSKIIKDPTKPTRPAPQPPNLDSLPPSSGNLYESPINWKNQKYIQSFIRQNRPLPPVPKPPSSGSLHGSYSSNGKNSKIIKDPTKPTRPAPQPPNLDSLPPSSGNLYESPINWKNQKYIQSLRQNRPLPPVPKPPPHSPIIAKKSTNRIVSTPKAFDYLNTPETTIIKNIT